MDFPILVQANVHEDPNHPTRRHDVTKAWFIIKDTTAGPAISEIFRHLPRDQPDFRRDPNNSALVGSFLYDIGGEKEHYYCRFSNLIRRLDTQNPAAGWKTSTLPFYCGDAKTFVSGNYLYIFPDADSVPDTVVSFWAYVYDTINQEARPIRPPEGAEVLPNARFDFCVPVDDHAALFCFRGAYGRKTEGVYRHNADTNSWQRLNEYSPLLEPYPCQPLAISNGMAYTCNISDPKNVQLCVYDTRRYGARYKIPLPNLNYPFDPEDVLHIVPVSDSKLCLLWNGVYGSKSCLYYAKIAIWLDPPRATLVSKVVFDINADEYSDVNCLAFSNCYHHVGEGEVILPVKVFDQVVDRVKEAEDWQRRFENLNKRCEDLEAENKMLRKNMVEQEELAKSRRID